MAASVTESALTCLLRDLPHRFDNRYSDAAALVLRKALCSSLVLNRNEALPLIFQNRVPDESGIEWSLRAAQGAQEGAEYTDAARGAPCGHIFRNGESAYHCKTCAADSTCVLCARCFAESDHEGHSVFVHISPGNSGCCDCADDEAWIRPVHCAIHKAPDGESVSAGKSVQPPALSQDYVEGIRRTIGKALDYMCDVFSCSPEQLRLPKTEQSILDDERRSRLRSDKYEGSEFIEDKIEYVLMLWNDEKHTVDQVRDQVARACRQSKRYGHEKAMEVDAEGRTVIAHSTDILKLLKMAKIMEQIKVSATIRSARDTFREAMCGTIIDWLSDVSGCKVGQDDKILRQTICSELFTKWSVGSPKSNVMVGQTGIHDHEIEDRQGLERRNLVRLTNEGRLILTAVGGTRSDADDDDADDNDDDDDDDMPDDDETETDAEDEQSMSFVMGGDATQDPLEVRTRLRRARIAAGDVMDIADEDGNVMVFPSEAELDINMDVDGDDNANETFEATMAGYPPPPPPPAGGPNSMDVSRQGSIADSQYGPGSGGSDDAETVIGVPSAASRLPKTPKQKPRNKNKAKKYWLAKPSGWSDTSSLPDAENLNELLRIDHLILYDLRLWKNMRDTLRHLYISTVITIPEFKRLLGVRFAGLYTLLAQLYLIADREPDHSIVNVSMQLLTTPSITAEVIEKANFLTNLMAILYTFLTTRQVGYPRDVLPQATLAFDAGAIANRRMFHFFGDARYIFQATSVQDRIRSEPQYLQQFVDLVKLHQGICPNVRALNEHVEYETDTWLSASVIVKEVNKLARLVTDSFLVADPQDPQAMQQITRAIKELTYAATISSLGMESSRFSAAEMKAPLKFRDVSNNISRPCVIPDVRVLEAHISFHHPLHYMTSWILQAAKCLTREQVQATFFTEFTDISVLQAKFSDSKPGNGPLAAFVRPHDWISAMFDPPLRVCVWLAQMRAGMWVRNGMTLRHQMHSYRSTTQRDITYQRDIFMLQAAMVLCDSGDGVIGEKFFLQMVYRFDLNFWLQGSYRLGDGFEDSQHMDVIEDFFQLLVIMLTEREDLLPQVDQGKPSKRALQRDIAHALCFKPQSYSDISSRLTDRMTEAEDFDQTLVEMTKYKAPEGLNDSGTFELKKEYIDLVDPYYAFYSRNQREEADGIYRDYQAKQRGMDKADVVPEPHLSPIETGLFKDLTSFTRTEAFAKIIVMAVNFGTTGHKITTVTKSRYESVLQVVLHLILLAVNEDIPVSQPGSSFVDHLLTPHSIRANSASTIYSSIKDILQIEEYAACHPRVKLIIKRAQEARPALFAQHNLLDQETRAVVTPNSAAAKEEKRRQALERQARVMAQMKAQQNDFMTKQGMDWDDDDDMSDGQYVEAMEDIVSDVPETEKTREWPADACILCQEDTNEDRLYGQFAFISGSSIQRQTPLNDDGYVQEVVDTPENLDRSAEGIRPFGKSSKNKTLVEKTTADGEVVIQHAQVLSEGFRDYKYIRNDHVITSCGHMMHYSCFETYLAATARRQSLQIQRNHPERLDKNEFLCPLCKALGNAFMPVIWRPRVESYPNILGSASQNFETWLTGDVKEIEARLRPAKSSSEEANPMIITPEKRTELARAYVGMALHSKITEQVMNDGTQSPSALGSRLRAARALASILDVRSVTQELSEGDNPGGSSNGTSSELSKAYKLLSNSLDVNSGETRPQVELPFNRLLQTIASTVAATEIQARGVYGEHSLLSAIPEHSMTNLRVLCETAAAMFAVESLKDPRFAKEAHLQESFGLSTLFGLEDADLNVEEPTSFRYNTFWSLTSCSYLPSEDWQKHGHNLIQFALLAEMVKVAVHHLSHRGDGTGVETAIDAPHEPEDPVFVDFLSTVATIHNEALQSDVKGMTRPLTTSVRPYFARILKRILQRHALIFLRKTALLVHVRSAVDISNAAVPIDPDAPELDRLSTLLRINSLPSLLSLFVSPSGAGQYLRNAAKNNMTVDIAAAVPAIPKWLDHPAIFELVGLPKTFDALSEEAVKRKCPTTGKHLTDPVVCLFCGDIFCSQGSCCMGEDGVGGAGQHVRKCGSPVGLFINIRKCMVLYLHERHGSWGLAPYLDKHGEVDPTLRRQHQLFLNQRRYDKLLRDVWLGHGVQNVISRKLEGDVNTGGWETL